MDAALTALMGISMAFVGGILYYEWYKKDVLNKIERAFDGGYDPALELVVHSKRAAEQRIISEAIDELEANQAEGVAMCDAHPDLEVFRLRLGKALNYEYNEDTQTGLFQRRDPREGGPGLDVERVMNKLEKVALRSARRTGKPLVLVINNVHYFNNDESGQNMLLQLQQRAESWAASGKLHPLFHEYPQPHKLPSFHQEF
ncbi:hypothetical protein EWM64_g9719 [Hericium alpestre]|uniref:Uncharacterized protein n=1 Tax=Hericium alpestre TaxID=135208 RepID=A0A4Y9ZIL9_9AGAM|nr:hypothetical protein EWM64_g9719 [Hericium alpestre]